MPPSRKPLEVNAGWVFWRSFFVIFLVQEAILWQDLQQWPVRVPGNRVILFLLGSRRSIFLAVVLGGALTLAVVLVVKLIVGPLLDLWLKPSVDPSSWLFYLAAGEAPLASIAGRWDADGRWQPGALVLTNRRIWFFPAAWGVEPWSLARVDLDRIAADPARLARLSPVRNWPDRVRFSARNGEEASFAVADPNAVLTWFGPHQRLDGDSPPPRIAPQGALDV